LGAALGALVIAAMAPWSASKANGVSVRVSTPDFGIRIGAPHHPGYYPGPVYVPPPVVYARPRYIPPPVVYTYPYHYTGSYRYHGRHHQGWRHHHRHHDRHWGHRGHRGGSH
jgi:hypothetical protein